MSLEPRQDWRRACARGMIIGIIAASHLVLLGWMLAPPKPRLRGSPRRAPHAQDLLRVELLQPAPEASRHAPVPRAPTRPPPTRMRRAVAPSHAMEATMPIASEPAPAPAASAQSSGFIAGGGFAARLRQAQAAPVLPTLPGGHHYMASDLAFVPAERQSIEGKVQQVAGLLFGGFDPVCRNLEHEQAKPRSQQIADGYTRVELARQLREQHCR